MTTLEELEAEVESICHSVTEGAPTDEQMDRLLLHKAVLTAREFGLDTSPDDWVKVKGGDWTHPKCRLDPDEGLKVDLADKELEVHSAAELVAAPDVLAAGGGEVKPVDPVEPIHIMDVGT